jgi:hypothetical protein
MKIGVVCEGGFTDEPVLKLLLEHLFPDTTFLIKGVDKAIIFRTGDVVLADLLSKADRVLVIWDLLPTGLKMGIPSQQSPTPCRKEQREMLLRLLKQSSCLLEKHLQQVRHLTSRYGFDPKPASHPNNGDDFFRLVCVRFSLDGWLLSDLDVLRDLGSTPAHPWRLASKPESPDSCRDPVAALKGTFKTAPNARLRYYNKHQHNLVVARGYVELGKVASMRVSESFCRVVDAIETWVRR